MLQLLVNISATIGISDEDLVKQPSVGDLKDHAQLVAGNLKVVITDENDEPVKLLKLTQTLQQITLSAQ